MAIPHEDQDSGASDSGSVALSVTISAPDGAIVVGVQRSEDGGSPSVMCGEEAVPLVVQRTSGNIGVRSSLHVLTGLGAGTHEITVTSNGASSLIAGVVAKSGVGGNRTPAQGNYYSSRQVSNIESADGDALVSLASFAHTDDSITPPTGYTGGTVNLSEVGPSDSIEDPNFLSPPFTGAIAMGSKDAAGDPETANWSGGTSPFEQGAHLVVSLHPPEALPPAGTVSAVETGAGTTDVVVQVAYDGQDEVTIEGRIAGDEPGEPVEAVEFSGVHDTGDGRLFLHFTGLDPGESYTIEGRAVNDAGESEWSTIATVTTFAVAPETEIDVVETFADGFDGTIQRNVDLGTGAGRTLVIPVYAYANGLAGIGPNPGRYKVIIDGQEYPLAFEPRYTFMNHVEQPDWATLGAVVIDDPPEGTTLVRIESVEAEAGEAGMDSIWFAAIVLRGATLRSWVSAAHNSGLAGSAPYVATIDEVPGRAGALMVTFAGGYANMPSNEDPDLILTPLTDTQKLVIDEATDQQPGGAIATCALGVRFMEDAVESEEWQTTYNTTQAHIGILTMIFDPVEPEGPAHTGDPASVDLQGDLEVAATEGEYEATEDPPPDPDEITNLVPLFEDGTWVGFSMESGVGITEGAVIIIPANLEPDWQSIYNYEDAVGAWWCEGLSAGTITNETSGVSEDISPDLEDEQQYKLAVVAVDESFVEIGPFFSPAFTKDGLDEGGAEKVRRFRKTWWRRRGRRL